MRSPSTHCVAQLPAARRAARNVRLVRHRERGVALFIALVVLLIITLVGVTSLQTTRLEERMAANALDRDTAFQAAEAALAGGETNVEDLEGAFQDQFEDNTAGYYEPAAPTETPRWEEVEWTEDDALPEADVELAGVTEPPKYIVEYVARVEVADEGSANLGQSGDLTGEQVDMFRVTAYGHGRSAETRVLLQSTYGKVAE